MDAPAKRRAVIFVVIAIVLLLFGIAQSGILIVLGNYLPFEGDVVSVGPSANAEKEAEVRLKWGTVVKASIPSACVVFPGQIATVNFVGPVIGAEPAFRLWESREKQ